MLFKLILFSGFAGITVFIGGLLARYFEHTVKPSEFKDRLIHLLMSFGAGIILSALVFTLIPHGMAHVNLWGAAITFSVGAMLFMLLDRYLASRGGQTATLMAMIMDFIPESIALGAVFAVQPDVALLLAVFIGLQNLPEAFNSYRELVMSGCSSTKTLVIFFILSLLGIVSALFGHFVLRTHPDLTSYLMMFASGGLLYLLIQDIIPESRLINTHTTALGATLGFLVGIIGEKLI